MNKRKKPDSPIAHLRSLLATLVVAGALATTACGGTTSEDDEPEAAMPGQEFNAAGGEMRSASYQLSFQLGRGTLSLAAASDDKSLKPNPILRTKNQGDNDQ